MEHIKFKMNDITLDRELIERLKNSPIILRFLKENNLSLDYIDTHAQTFNTYLEQLKKCEGCKGLKYCRQAINGRVFKLKYDGILSNVLVPCKFKVKDTVAKKHLKNYSINDMSEKFKTVKFEDIVLENETKKYRENLGVILDAIEEKERGLYLVGNVGSGKTFLASCAANKFALDGWRVAFINLPLFSQRIKNNLESGEYKSEIDKIINADFLVIDDIGAETVTSWFRDEILFNILNERMENNLLTWFTSNEDFKSLQSHYELNNRKVEEKIKGERIMARIKSLSKELNIVGKDRRN